MPTETLIGLAAYALAALWTPGPNNIMLASSGAVYGWRRTQPHAFGVVLGFAVMLFSISLGLGQAFEQSALLRRTLTWAGLAAMLYLAWRIARAGPPPSAEAADMRQSKPLSFWQAAGFQWINPKAWVLCIGVSATYLSGLAPVKEAAAATAVFGVLGMTSCQGWTLFGTGLGRILGTGWRLRAFNAAMGALLAASALWLVLE